MGRKIIKIAIIIFVIGCTLGNESYSTAAGIQKAYNLEQAVGKAPNVKAYVTGKKVSKKSKFNGRITGDDIAEGLELQQTNIQLFKKSGEGIRYIVLLDNSASVDKKQFQQMIKELIKIRRSLRSKDELLLYTVGADKATGKKTKVISAKGKKNTASDVKKIKKIKRTKKKTVLYRSLTEILENVNGEKIRTVILLATDGEDDSQGKSNKSYEINPLVKKTKVPIYGLLFKNVSKKPNKAKMQNTRKHILNERVSRGYYEVCTSKKDVTKGIKNIKKIILQNTYIVTMREVNNSNQTTINASLYMTAKGVETVLGKDIFSYNQVGEEDTVAPSITDIKKVNKNSIQFMLKDDKSAEVFGADNKENYIVKSKNGDTWEIAEVKVKSGQGHIYEMVFKDDLYTDEYTIQCSHITDASVERNEIKDSFTFSFKGLNRSKEDFKSMVKSYWWIVLILLVMIIGAIIIVIVKRKPGQIIEIPQDDGNQADSKLIRLTITDRAGTVKDVEWNVEGSIFVGRSNICNIFFDDDRLSRQHFAIEVTKMACYIEDLETTNATFVNGVKITGKRMLIDGDVITAGREKFVFHTVDNGGGM